MNAFTQLSKQMKIIFIAFGIVVLGAIISSVYLWSKVQNLENPNLATDKEIKELVGDIGRYLILPTNETPTLATVSDPEKLKSQPFFANAQIGDKVLIYTASKKVILWRPSISKIVEISGLNVSPVVNPASGTSGVTR